MKAKGLKQNRLAELIGVTPQSVTDWVKGRTLPDVRKLQELARILGTSVDVLTQLDEPESARSISRISRVKVDLSRTKNLPLISIKGQASIVERSLEGCQLQFIEDFYQLYLPDIELDEKKHVIVEVEGDSMEPDIKNRAKVLGASVASQNIKYESNAVFAVLYAERFVLKRVKTNDIIEKGRLVLHSDNDRYGPMSVDAGDIKCMWKILRIVDSPVY